ncbi:MAG: cadherin-like domain-containing protein [Acidobacteria bacterium]|nr:cadherin-like domain-containing protein [Acidobacteriota bacterium]
MAAARPAAVVVSAESAVVNFRLNQIAEARIDYGVVPAAGLPGDRGEGELYPLAETSRGVLNAHSITLSDLESATRYRYRITVTTPDGDALTYTIVTAPAHGTLDGVAPDLTYTPDEGFIGEDSFTFTANDGPEESPAATVVITVTAPADPPATDEQPVESSPEAP